MKRIIAFVLLGLLIYAGGFVIYYAYTDLKTNISYPKNISTVQYDSIHTGQVIGGSIYQVLDEIRTETVQPKLFGIPFGEEITQHYYVLPLEAKQMYMLIAVSDKQDLEIIERIKRTEPKEYDPDDLKLEFIGVAEEIPPLDQTDLKYYLMSRLDLIGIDDDEVFVRPTETLVVNHIVPYTIYIKHPSGTDFVPLIVGVAMCVVGLGLTVLLIVRIQREKESY